MTSQTIKLPTRWIKRLTFYTDRVRNTSDKPNWHKMAIVSLLGYLESLDYFLETHEEGK